MGQKTFPGTTSMTGTYRANWHLKGKRTCGSRTCRTVTLCAPCKANSLGPYLDIQDTIDDEAYIVLQTPKHINLSRQKQVDCTPQATACVHKGHNNLLVHKQEHPHQVAMLLGYQQQRLPDREGRIQQAREPDHRKSRY